MKRWLALAALLVVCLGVAAWLALRAPGQRNSATAASDTGAASRVGPSKGKPGKGPAAPVTVAEVKEEDVPIELAAFGTVEASTSVEVVPQVSGQITEVHFVEGAFVKKGDLLFSVDTRPYRASLAAARAELARSSALARQAESEAQRYAELAQQGVATGQQLTQAQADAASARAQMEQMRAQIDSASLNVKFTRITAPIDGKTGSLLVHAGNVIQASAGQPLVVIRSLSPVQVRFAVPQQHLTAIRNGLAGGALPVRASARGEGAEPAQGQLTFLENSVDTATGTISLKASFTNRDLALWPGASVDVVLTLGSDQDALVVPAEAVREAQDGTYVFVVGPDQKVRQQPVAVLRTTAELALLRPPGPTGDGVRPQERVVTDGFVRLRDGVQVTIQPAPPPASQARLGPEPAAPGAVR